MNSDTQETDGERDPWPRIYYQLATTVAIGIAAALAIYPLIGYVRRGEWLAVAGVGAVVLLWAVIAYLTVIVRRVHHGY